MNVYVFLGPSLPIERARAELGSAVFLPPARRGDVYRVVAERRPSIIGIVDGLFDSVPAVVHKEILFALSQGVRVLGAASMGALRAAELWPFGMEGVGRIFDKYRSGEWNADDEVAVTHGPAEVDYRSSSVAMANIRLALEDAGRRGVIGDATVSTLTAVGKRQFYADRSWAALDKLGAEAGVPPEELAALSSYLIAERPDAKRDDALTLLRRLRELIDSEEAPPSCDFVFEETVYWERVIADTTPNVEERGQEHAGVSRQEVFRHVLNQPAGAEIMRGAALLHLLGAHVHAPEETTDELEKRAALDRFRRRHGLLTVEQTQEWMEAQHLTQEELLFLVELELTLDSLAEAEAESVRQMVPLELKRRGELAGVMRVIARKKQLLREAGVRNLTLDDAGIGFSDLLDWYQSTRGSIDGSLTSHAERLGFRSVREFLSEVLLDYVTQNS